MTGTESIDQHLKAYVDLFIARFESIEGEWRKPWLPTLAFVSQNAAGHLYSGVNDINLSLTCAMKGYSVPIWLTSSQCRDLGVMRLKGESGTQVFWGGTSFFDKEKGALDGEMRWAEYQSLSEREKERYSLREGAGHSTYVWNIEQTDFPSRNPETWSSLRAAFRKSETEYSEETLDAFLDHGSWYPDDCHNCPIVLTDRRVAQYDRESGCIELPKKELFSDPHEFYNTMLHTMAHSAIIENAFAAYKGDGDPLEDIARLNLSSELAAAVIAGRLGMSQTLSESSLEYLKEWTRILSDDPSAIQQAVKDSRYAVILLTERLDIGQKEAPDVCATLGEQIRQAQVQREAARASRAENRAYSTTNQRTGKPRLRRGRSARI